MKLLYVLAAACLTVAATPAFAEHDEVLVIINQTDQPIANVTAKPGKVIGFKTIQPGSKRQFTLRMPNGVCETTMSTVLPDGQSFKNKVEVCGGLTFTWGLALD